MEEKDNTKTNSSKSAKISALKHGILSKYTILPWENLQDYAKLLNSLIEEYRPKYGTKEHLVGELAGVTWKKCRLRYAERAYYQQALNNFFKSITKTSTYKRYSLVNFVWEKRVIPLKIKRFKCLSV